MSTNKIFLINEIPINIYSVSPVLVESTYKDLSNYIKTVKITYEIKYNDITWINQSFEDPTITLRESLEISLPEDYFSSFIKYEDIVQEDFYPLAIEAARSSETIQNIVKRVRIRTGLDIAPPRIISTPAQVLPFKARIT